MGVPRVNTASASLTALDSLTATGPATAKRYYPANKRRLYNRRFAVPQLRR